MIKPLKVLQNRAQAIGVYVAVIAMAQMYYILDQQGQRTLIQITLETTNRKSNNVKNN